MVLFVCAHSDDESFWAGGTIALLSERDKVAVAALSDGVGSRFSYDRDCAVMMSDYQQARKQRHKAFLRACGVLRAECVQLDTFPDQGADTVDQLEINRSVAVLIDDYQPTVVYTHHPGDLNVDHRRTAEAVFVAMRGSKSELYTMRPEWPHLCVGQKWNPGVLVSFTTRMTQARNDACACYEDELREPPHPRAIEMLGVHERFMRIQ